MAAHYSPPPGYPLPLVLIFLFFLSQAVNAATITITNTVGTCPISQQHVTTTITPTQTISPTPSSSSSSSSQPKPSNSTPDGSCGPMNGYTCQGDDNGGCCSQYGFCGWGDPFCGAGCQEDYGACYYNPSSSGLLGSMLISPPSTTISMLMSTASSSSVQPPQASSSLLASNVVSLSGFTLAQSSASTSTASSAFTTPSSQAEQDAEINSGAPFVIPIDIPVGGTKKRRDAAFAPPGIRPFLARGLDGGHHLGSRATSNSGNASAVVRTYIMPNGNTTTDYSKAAIFSLVSGVLCSSGLPISAGDGTPWIPFAGHPLPLSDISTAWVVSNGSISWQNATFDGGVARIYRTPAGQVDNEMVVILMHGPSSQVPDAAAVPAANANQVGPPPASSAILTSSLAMSTLSSIPSSVADVSTSFSGATLIPSSMTESSGAASSALISGSTSQPSMGSSAIMPPSMLSSMSVPSSTAGASISMAMTVSESVSSSTAPSTVLVASSMSFIAVASTSLLTSASPQVSMPSMSVLMASSMPSGSTMVSNQMSVPPSSINLVSTSTAFGESSLLNSVPHMSSAMSLPIGTSGIAASSVSTLGTLSTTPPMSSASPPSSSSVVRSSPSISKPGLSSSQSPSSAGMSSSPVVIIPSSQAPVSAASSISAPQPTISAAQPTSTSHICPENNGTTFLSPCGSTYTLQCGIDHSSGNLDAPNGMYVNSFDECVAMCDARPECVDAAWVSGVTGPCYLKGTVGFAVSSPGVWTAEQLTYGGVTCQVASSSALGVSSGSFSTVGISSQPAMVPSSSSRASSMLSMGSPSSMPTNARSSTIPSSGSASSASMTVSCGPSPSSERGLVSFDDMMGDYGVWIQPCSSVVWYYNYASTPYAQFSNTQLQYVPMLFGNDPINFTSAVLSLINQGYNISHVLAFNEPDQPFMYGGSDLDPQTAATRWQSDIEPLRQYGVKLGAPAISFNVTWLQDFFALCAGCNIDFIPFHFYGPLYSPVQGVGFYDRYYQLVATFPGATFWLTEWADTNVDLPTTQSNYEGILNFIEGQADIQRHSYFGSFRSDVSNVGYNATMLDQCGRLTDIGDSYLNKPAQGNIPGPGTCTLPPASSSALSSTVSSSSITQSGAAPSSTSSAPSVVVVSSTVMVIPVPASSSIVPSPSCLPAYQGAIDCPISSPGADGQIYTSQEGAQFNISCGINYADNDMPQPNGVGCVAVAWVPSSPTGACYLKSAVGQAQDTGSVFGAFLINYGPCPGHVSTSGTPIAAPSTSSAPTSSSVVASVVPTSSAYPSGCNPSPTSLLHLPTPTPILVCISPDEAPSFDDDDLGLPAPPSFPVQIYTDSSTAVFVSTNGVGLPSQIPFQLEKSANKRQQLLSLDSGSPQFATESLPSQIIPPVTACPFWIDMAPQDYDQGIWYYSNTTTLIVEYRLTDADDPTSYAQFQVIYSISAPGVLVYRYYSVLDSGVNAEIGVQGGNNGPAVNFGSSLAAQKIQPNQQVTCDTTVQPNGSCTLQTSF